MDIIVVLQDFLGSLQDGGWLWLLRELAGAVSGAWGPGHSSQCHSAGRSASHPHQEGRAEATALLGQPENSPTVTPPSLICHSQCQPQESRGAGMVENECGVVV